MFRQVAAALACALTVGAAHAAPMMVALSPHFKIYSAEGEADLRARANGLERYDAVLHSLTGTRDSGDVARLTVYIVPDLGAVGAGDNVLGYYRDPAAGPFVVTPRRLHGVMVSSLPQIILYHEYAHHFMLQNFVSAYSPWFVEGFAEFYSTTEISGSTAAVGKPEPLRIHSLTVDTSLQLQKLLVPVRGLDARQVDALYARGWLLVHYLTLSPKRKGQLEAYLRARSTGEAEEHAFQTAFGTSIAGIDKELKDYIANGQLSFVTLDVPDGAAVTVRPATPGEAVTTKLMVRLREAQDFLSDPAAKHSVSEQTVIDHGLAQLAIDARGAARKAPDDAEVQVLVAEAELLAGQVAEARAAAETALRLDAANGRASLAVAAAMIAAGPAGDRTVIAAARKRIVAGNRAAPDDPMPLIAYYRSFADHGEPVPPLAVQGLERAQQLAPQDGSVRVMLAKEEIALKRYAVASGLLRPVAYAPHGGEQRTAALALLKTLPGDHEAAPAPVGVSGAGAGAAPAAPPPPPPTGEAKPPR